MYKLRLIGGEAVSYWPANSNKLSELIFDTKENNNRRREAAFLRLTPDQRFQTFLRMVDEFSKFTTKTPIEEKGNLILEKKSIKDEFRYIN